MGLSLMHISPQAWADMTIAARHDAVTLHAQQQVHDAAVEWWRTQEHSPKPERKLNPYPVCNPRVRIAHGGLLFQVKTEGTQPEWCIGKKRGKVTFFSRAARARAMQLCLSVNIDKAGGLPILVTLTYPDEFPTDGPTTKGHLDAFLKRLYRFNSEVSAIWKVEPQKRGAPHYHLLVFNMRYLPKDWVATAWASVVDSGDAKHLHAGTRVEQVYTYKGVVSYATKYICKRVEDDKNWTVGRWWGVHNRKRLPVDVEEYSLSDEQYYKLRRIYQAYMHSKHIQTRRTKAAKGYTAFLHSDKSISILDHIAT